MRAEPEARLGGSRALRLACGAALVAGLGGCGSGAGSGPAVRVTIPAHSSMRAASNALARAGLVHGATLFRVYAKLLGRDRAIRSGTYSLKRGAGWNTLLDDLQRGRGLVHVVTIPEGFSLAQIAAAISTKLGQPVDSVYAAARDTSLLHTLDVPTPTLEGYLFPDTYMFSDGTTARAAVDEMVHRFEQVWEPAWTARLDTLHLSRNDLMALAAIVEKEAKLPQERPVIAAVYLNRLRRGMLLQADPTVQYALGKHVTRVYFKDLEVDSPYNTYKHPGLPPGPIASPGKASIEAALYPANVPYLYFVAFPDGHHEFRSDLASHDVAVAAARRAWDSVDVAHGTPPAGTTAGPPAVSPQ